MFIVISGSKEAVEAAKLQAGAGRHEEDSHRSIVGHKKKFGNR